MAWRSAVFLLIVELSYNHDLANSNDKEFESERYDSDLRSKQLHAWRPRASTDVAVLNTGEAFYLLSEVGTKLNS